MKKWKRKKNVRTCQRERDASTRSESTGRAAWGPNERPRAAWENAKPLFRSRPRAKAIACVPFRLHTCKLEGEGDAFVPPLLIFALFLRVSMYRRSYERICDIEADLGKCIPIFKQHTEWWLQFSRFFLFTAFFSRFRVDSFDESSLQVFRFYATMGTHTITDLLAWSFEYRNGIFLFLIYIILGFKLEFLVISRA